MTERPKALQLYLTQPAPCPYLEGRTEQKLIAMPEGDAASLCPALNAQGFRRSQNMYYRPHCPACRSCVPARLRLADFRPGKPFLRILRKNADLFCAVTHPGARPEDYALFLRYQAARHGGGEMEKMQYPDFLSMMETSPVDTRRLVCRAGDRTLGMMLFDDLPDGASAVYSFFEPAEERRSLGSFMILKLAEYAAAEGKPYLYLGYWVKDSPKMDYKSRFQPLEIFMNERWAPFDGAPL